MATRSEFVLRDPRGEGELRLLQVVLGLLCTCCDVCAQAHVSTQTKNVIKIIKFGMSVLDRRAQGAFSVVQS